MISDSAIHEALATLARLKNMNPPRARSPQRVGPRVPYVRTPEEQAQLDRVRELVDRAIAERRRA